MSPRRRVCPRLWIVAMLLGACLAIPSRAGAQNSSGGGDGGSGSSEPPKTIDAGRVGAEAVVVDGILDDAAWAEATFRSDFRQKGRDRAFAPRVQTEVAFLYDDGALYVAARMQGDTQGRPRTAAGQRDDGGNTERLLVSLDTYRDRRTAFTFGVTAGGVRLDHVHARDNEGWADDSFDPVWQAEVSRDERGWTAEMRIPFSQLRFSPGDEQVWGLNVRRWNPATFLNVYWVAVPIYEAGWVSRFGEIGGLEGISAGARIELVPYALRSVTTSDPEIGTPRQVTTRFGGDVKAGLGPNVTLEATVNPDFGQVEADPARVNLTAFETFFPERRPFFLEGRQLFAARGPNYFYSRRIGSTPALASGDELVEQVRDVTVLGGAKLTGRLPSGFSVGALAALSDRERVVVPGSDGPRAVASPRTGFAVGRLQQEVGRSGSTIGLLGTAVERFLDGDATLGSLLPRRAFTGGGDLVVRSRDGQLELTGFVGGSHVVGSRDALVRLQRSSTHYFQRPDADHVRLDAAATSLSGWTAGLDMGKVAGEAWRWRLGVEAASPGFEIRDAGSQARADHLGGRAALSYSVRAPRSVMRGRSIGMALDASWNFGGTRRRLTPSLHASAVWGNLWSTTLQAGFDTRATSDDLTRGGPLMGTGRAWWTLFQVASPSTSWIQWSLETDTYRDEFGGWSVSGGAGTTVQAGSRLDVSLFLLGSQADDSRLFADEVTGGTQATYGRRYVFSRMDRRQASVQLRTRIALSPDAVVTFYGEPFQATGRAHDFGELVAAGSRALRRYGSDGTTVTLLPDGTREVVDGEETFLLGDYDFRVRSFRGTAVFQWEWRRGSALYLIWQRNNWSLSDRPWSRGGDWLLDSLRDPGQDVLALKLSVLVSPG